MIRSGRATFPYKAARRSLRGHRAALVALVALIALSLNSCARNSSEPPAPIAPSEETGWPIEGGRIALALSADGRLTPIRGQANAGPEAGEPRPFATQPALAAMAIQGQRLVIALNRLGLRSLTIVEAPKAEGDAGDQAQERRVRLTKIASPAAAFSSRSVGRFWPFGLTLRLFLYRHPYFESEPPSGTSHAVLELGAENAYEAIELNGLERAINGRAALFAIYPLGRGALLYQTREEQGERVQSAYGRYDERSGTAIAMSKQAFEAALQPLPLTSAPVELRALAALVPDDIVIDLSRSDGSTQSYYRGSLADSTQAWASIGAEGAILAAADGRGAYLPITAGRGPSQAASLESDTPRARAFDLNAELGLPGMRFREPLVFAGFAAFIWEEELFPLLGRSGLLLVDCRDLGL